MAYEPRCLRHMSHFDCVNSSPPLISRKFQGFGGVWANSGNSGNFGKSQWNSVEFSGACMALSMNSVGIPGGFRGNTGFSAKFGVWVVSGDLGGQKAFAQIARVGVVFNILMFVPQGLPRDFLKFMYVPLSFLSYDQKPDRKGTRLPFPWATACHCGPWATAYHCGRDYYS